MELVISDTEIRLTYFTYDIARQSVVDKMVREISLEVREKSGKFFSHFCGNPDMIVVCPFIIKGFSKHYLYKY